MTGVGIGKASALGIEDGVEAGDEHVGRDVGKERLVDSLEHLPRRGGVALGCKPQHAAGCGHDQSRWHPLARCVPHHKPQTALREVVEVVEVSSYLVSGPVEGSDLPAL